DSRRIPAALKGLAVALLLGLLGGRVPLLAQKKPAPAPAKPEAAGGEELFVDTVNVNVVNVDVYVTDKKGNRVNGLTKNDFELFEDNRPVAITNFFAVENGKSNAREEPPPAPAAGSAPAPAPQPA